MRIAFNPSTVAALIAPPNNKDITFDLRGHNIFARGVKFCGTDTNTWRDIKINNVSIGSNTLDLRDGDNTTLTNINGVVTINSTWRPVVDNLTSDSTTSSLSANLGRILAGLINGKSDSGHNHDDRYVKKSGDTMRGALNFANGTWNLVGDDVYMGDHNIGGQLCIMGANGTTGLSFHKLGDASIRKSITFDGNTLYMNGSCDYATLSNLTNLLAMNTVPNKTAATSIGSWSPISGRYVFHQKWTDTSTGGDSADFGIYLDGNLTANMVLDGYYNSLLGFRVIGATSGFLKANGTIDNSTYLTSHLSLSNYYTKSEVDTKLNSKLNYRLFWERTNIDLNSITEAWHTYEVNNGTGTANTPTNASWHQAVLWGTGDTNYAVLLCTAYTSNYSLYLRHKIAGKWYDWIQLATTTDIPSSLKNPYALTISLNGTSLGPYDGSAAKNINITPSSIGAATSDHNHINYLSANGLISGNIDNIWTHGTYGFGNRSSYTGTLPGNSSYGGFLVLNPNATTTGTYYTTQIALLPGYFGYRIYDDGKWYDWKEVSMVGHNHDGRYVRYYAVTTLDCNNLAVGLTVAGVSATNAAHTNHSAYLYISDVGTPFQIQIPDSSVPYIYKRYYSSGTWSGWFKLNAGYADSAGSASNLTVHLYLSNTDTTWWPLIWGGSSHNNTSDSTGEIYKSHDKLSWLTSSLTLYATNLYTGRLETINNHYYRFNSDATLRIYGSSNSNSAERIYFLAGIDNRIDDYDIPSYGGELRHSIILNPRGGFVGIGDTNPSYKLSVGGDIGTGGNIYISHATNNNMNYNTSNPRIVFSEYGTLAVGLVYTDYDSYRRSKGLKVMDVNNDDTSNVWFEVLGYNYSSGYVKNGSNDNYVLLGGGGHKLESSLNVASASVASKVYGQVGDTGSYELVRCDMNNDQFRIIAGSSGNNNGWAEIATADDGSEPIYVRQYTGVFSSVKRTLTLLDANGYTHFPSYINIGGNENNNSSPDRVWGSNGSDSYLRSYRTSALNVNYANSADRANYLSGHGVNPDNSHPGHGARVFYSWDTGCAGNSSSGYSNGITIGSHPGDTNYGFLIVQNMWDDRTYTRRYNGGWQSWKTLAWTSDIPTVTDYYWANIKISASSNTQTQPSVNTIYANNWFRSQGDSGWYSESYGGGIWMNDSNWIRTFGGKSFYCDNLIYSSNSIRMSDILLEHTNEINSDSGIYLNFRNSSNINLCLGGGNVGIGTTAPSYKLDVNGDIWCRGALRVGSSATDNYIAFYGNTGDAPGSFATSFIGEHLWGGDESTELLLMKFNDVGNGIDGITPYSSGPDRIRHIAHAHVFLIMTDSSLGDFATMAATTAVETKLDITRNRITASVPLYLQSDLHVNGALQFHVPEAHIGHDGSYSDPWGGLDANFKFGGVLAATHIYSNGGFHKYGGNENLLLRADGGVAAFNWAGLSGLPTWLWGGNNFNSYYVYNPSNFRVAYASSAGNADTLGGIPRNYSQAPFNKIPCVDGDGVMDIGRYIDFHYDNSGSYDFSTRLLASGNNRNVVTLPSESGTLALTSYGGDSSHPIFLGYLNLDHGDDGTISSSFYCLGYSVSFTYTRGGNYCRIYIPDTSYQTFYIRAATASVNYSGGGMDTWVGTHRGNGAWWLHCYASGTNEVRVKGFCQNNSNNDSWWGGNPLGAENASANKITVCIFGYVTFK